MKESVLKLWLQNEKNFLGVYPSDIHCLPTILRYPCCLISNTEPHYMSGEHWIAIFFRNNQIVEYFDPYGLPPLIKSHRIFMGMYARKIIFNKKKIQGIFSKTCGGHCIVYLKLKALGFKMNQIQKFYSKNARENDYLVEKLYFEN